MAIEPDSDLLYADWAKTTWDLYDDDFNPIDSIEQLRVALQRMQMTPQEFMQLPVYTHNVAKMPWLNALADRTRDTSLEDDAGHDTPTPISDETLATMRKRLQPYLKKEH